MTARERTSDASERAGGSGEAKPPGFDNDNTRANGRLVGQLLGICGIILAIAALVAWFEFLPFSTAASRALTILLAVTSVVDLLVAFFFISRSRE